MTARRFKVFVRLHANKPGDIKVLYSMCIREKRHSKSLKSYVHSVNHLLYIFT